MSAEQYRYNKLVEEINLHNHRYHNLDKPTITDSEFDKLMQELINLESKEGIYLSPISPTRRVGGARNESLRKSVHLVKMLSLNNIFCHDQIFGYLESVIEDLGKDKFTYYCEPKYDGLAINLRYVDGVLMEASTRGDGEVGENVTDNIRTIKSVPLKLEGNYPPLLEVRGEVIIKRSVFNELNETRKKDGLTPYSNPRNLAAGSVRQLDPKITASRQLTFIPYGIGEWEGTYKPALYEYLVNRFTEWGFTLSGEGKVLHSVDEIESYCDDLYDRRDSLDFDIDGVVLKINEYVLKEKLNDLTRAPMMAIAYKFVSQGSSTTLLDVSFNVGRTGAITPVAHFNPIEVGGVVISNATLHNFKNVRNLDIGIGDIILVERAGDVIPYISEVFSREDGRDPIALPNFCPCCKTLLSFDIGSITVYCRNPGCRDQLKARAYNFVSKGGMNIDGLGPGIVDKLVDGKYIKDMFDIFKLTIDDFISCGVGKELSKKLIDKIHKAKKVDYRRLLVSLGIPNLGPSTANVITLSLPNPNDFVKAINRELNDPVEFGEAMASSFKTYFSDPKYVKSFEKFMESIDITFEETTGNKLKGEVWVVTGSFVKYTRDQIQQLIVKLGGEISGTVSKRVTHILTGDRAGSKLDKARSLNIAIYDEKAFDGLIEAARKENQL